MEDFRVKTSFRNNRKRKLLQRKLGPEGVLALIDLWSYCAENHTDGKLTGLSDEEIEVAADWNGDPGTLIDTLCQVGFLHRENGVACVHDWVAHNPWVSGMHARSKKAKRAAEKRWGSIKNPKNSPEKTNGKQGVNARSINEHCYNSDRAMLKPESGNAPSPYPLPLPSPSPNPIPDPEHDISLRTINDRGVSLGWMPMTESQKQSIRALMPISVFEFEAGIENTGQRAVKPNFGYFAAIIRGEREEEKRLFNAVMAGAEET